MEHPLLPVILGGIPDIVDGSKCGLLFEPGDVEDLTSKIDLILEDQSGWENLANFDNKWIMMHRIEIITEKWRNVFSELSN